MEYVVGFAFNKNQNLVLLQHKLRPEWQNGFLNGIGGKIENETPLEAMHRECKEETGLILGWTYKGILYGTNNDGKTFNCHIFYAYNDNIINFKQIKDEKLEVVDLCMVKNLNTIDNVKFLLEYGMCEDDSQFIKVLY